MAETRRPFYFCCLEFHIKLLINNLQILGNACH